ncbi:MAG TPA: hypothetical protein VK644_01555 [Chitinophagaceae bacterium]|nr:hypothetical protein [Chitinophagaceae bacterium]
MATKITTIFTDDTTPRRYISATSRRSNVTDANLLAELTSNPNEAHDFGTADNARAIIPRLHNPYDRKYQHERICVDRPATSIDESYELK